MARTHRVCISLTREADSPRRSRIALITGARATSGSDAAESVSIKTVTSNLGGNKSGRNRGARAGGITTARYLVARNTPFSAAAPRMSPARPDSTRPRLGFGISRGGPLGGATVAGEEQVAIVRRFYQGGSAVVVFSIDDGCHHRFLLTGYIRCARSLAKGMDASPGLAATATSSGEPHGVPGGLRPRNERRSPGTHPVPKIRWATSGPPRRRGTAHQAHGSGHHGDHEPHQLDDDAHEGACRAGIGHQAPDVTCDEPANKNERRHNQSNHAGPPPSPDDNEHACPDQDQQTRRDNWIVHTANDLNADASGGEQQAGSVEGD